MRILSIYTGVISRSSGTPLRARKIIKYLTEVPEMNVHVFSCDGSVDGIQEHTEITGSFFRDRKFFTDFVKKANIDIVIGHTTSAMFYLLYAKFFLRKKIVLEMHGFIEEEWLLVGHITKARYWVKKTVFTLFYLFCDLITTSSDTATEILRKFNKNVVTIFCVPDIEFFNPKISSGGYVQRKPEDIVIGYAGNSRVWQGLPFLIESFKKIAKTNQSFKLFLLSGDIDISEHDGIQVVHGLPFTEVPRALVDCDILVIPRPQNMVNYLSFPSKLIDYMSLGKAVIATKTSDCHRVVTNNVDGLLIDPEDEEGFISALNRLTSVELRQRLGNAALNTVLTKYTSEIQIAILTEHLKRLN